MQTQSSAVTSTISVEQLKELPLVSRNALYAVAFLPGVETAGGPRGATISGLPNNTVNITIDGISTGNALQSTDGFFSMVTPRLDAVEEITVTGAVPGAGGGSGAVQVAFTTRSGTNTFNSSIYHYFRHPDLNTNYYFNKVNDLDKNEVIVHQYGGRVGGPIVIPGLFDGRNKAFFFFNLEHQYQPSEATRTRTILNPQARQGIFSYNVTVGGVQQLRTVDLVQLAADQQSDVHVRSDDYRAARRDARVHRRPPARQHAGGRNHTGSRTSTRPRPRATSTRRRRASTST